MFEVDNWREAAKFDHPGVKSPLPRVDVVTWSPDGKLLAIGDNRVVRIIEIATARELYSFEFQGEFGPKLGINWNPDGRRIAFYRGYDALISDVPDGKVLSQITLKDSIDNIRWNSDGRFLAVAASDRTARILDSAGRELAILDHENSVGDVAWSLQQATPELSLVTGSTDGSVKLWPVFASTQELVTTVKSKLARCLTQSERKNYFLSAAPPSWCIQRRLWPYHTDEWQVWQSKRKVWLSTGGKGPEPTLPTR